jgi:hypothetical protein
MLIYDALKNDHNKVKQLLDELVLLKENATVRRKELISQIRDELIPHSRAEEAVFYNSLRAIDSAKDVIMHGYQEHIEAETALRMLQVRDKIDIEWKNTATKLRDSIYHHIDEEEGRVFSVAQQLFTKEEAEIMAEAFEKLKPEIREEGFLRTTFDMVVNMMPPKIAASLRTYNVHPKI